MIKKNKKEDKPPQGKFTVTKVTRIEDLVRGKQIELPESDLCFQNETAIVQLEYTKPDEDRKFKIEPGIYTLVQSNSGLQTAKIELRSRELLDTIDNTSRIIKEARLFFQKLHIYEKRNRPKKRGVLLYSKPGMGKSSAVSKFCSDFCKEDPGTVVINWPTSDIEAEQVSRFLSVQSTFTKECTRMVLIIEDIGGGESEGRPDRHGVSSGLLNLLDGVDVNFRLPTFIVATTNHPENLLESLADRPGRFDLMIELNPPSLEERKRLLSFIAARDLTAVEEKALATKGAEHFSIAHLEEIVDRAELHDKTYPQVIDELIAHKKRFQDDFADKKKQITMSDYD
jgi:SpoVK/Ycf46/Vps4 family AAA+-type ATPase